MIGPLTTALQSSVSSTAYMLSCEGRGCLTSLDCFQTRREQAMLRLFYAAHSALLLTSGDVEELEVGHFNFEMTAITSYEAEFPGVL